MPEEKELPRYKCLKTVWALTIKFINPVTNILIFEEDYPPLDVGETYIKQHKPYVGGYFVVYEDGYRSFSPAEPFENGYKLIE